MFHPLILLIMFYLTPCNYVYPYVPCYGFSTAFFGGYPQFACMYIVVPYLFYSVSILCICVYILMYQITFLRPPFLRREHKRYNYPYVNYCYSGLETCLSVNTCALLIPFCIVFFFGITCIYILFLLSFLMSFILCAIQHLGSFLFQEHDVLHLYYL